MNQTIDISAGAVPAVFLSQPSLLDAPVNPRLAAWEEQLVEQVSVGTDGPAPMRPPLGPGGSVSGCSWVGGGGWDDCDE